MRVAGPLHLISVAERNQVQMHLRAYLTTAINEITLAGAAGTPAANRVQLWFGWTTAGMRDNLAHRLRQMHDSLNDYFVNGALHERTVEISQGLQQVLGANAWAAAAYVVNQANMNRHFYVRVYAAHGFAAFSYPMKVRAIVHEISHRIVATRDFTYNPGPCQALAAGHNPQQARNNADNFSFFVVHCNPLLNADPQFGFVP